MHSLDSLRAHSSFVSNTPRRGWRLFPALVALLAVTTIPRESPAQDIHYGPSSGLSSSRRAQFQLSGRLGYGIALGDLYENVPISRVYAGVVPFLIDVGVRLPFGTMLGGYGGLSLGVPKDEDDGLHVNFRVGLEAIQHFASGRPVDPWVGLGLGFESSVIHDEDYSSAYSVTATYLAFPELLFQAGVDFGNERGGFGPFVSASLATYTQADASFHCRGSRCSSPHEDWDIPSSAHSPHSLLLFGVRGTFLSRP